MTITVEGVNHQLDTLMAQAGVATTMCARQVPAAGLKGRGSEPVDCPACRTEAARREAQFRRDAAEHA